MAQNPPLSSSSLKVCCLFLILSKAEKKTQQKNSTDRHATAVVYLFFFLKPPIKKKSETQKIKKKKTKKRKSAIKLKLGKLLSSSYRVWLIKTVCAPAECVCVPCRNMYTSWATTLLGRLNEETFCSLTTFKQKKTTKK